MIALACDTSEREAVIVPGSAINRQAAPATDATARRIIFIFIV
jgi:hypothetical protein